MRYGSVRRSSTAVFWQSQQLQSALIDHGNVAVGVNHDDALADILQSERECAAGLQRPLAAAHPDGAQQQDDERGAAAIGEQVDLQSVEMAENLVITEAYLNNEGVAVELAEADDITGARSLVHNVNLARLGMGPRSP